MDAMQRSPSFLTSRVPPTDQWMRACQSSTCKSLLDKAARFATCSLPVMIVGECGTGKIQLAHHLISRDQVDVGQVVHVACHSVFGMNAPRLGQDSIQVLWQRHQQNPDATWIFDRVDMIPESCQAQFLRLAEAILSLSAPGRNRPTIVSTAEPEVVEAVSTGHYHRELYYRLSVLELKTPQLREHREDLSALLAFFASQLSADTPPVIRFSTEAVALLEQHHWPGNVLELRNVVAQLCVLSDKLVIEADDLVRHWTPIQSPSSVPDLANCSLEDAETHLILQAVTRCQGNKTAAAKQLGITTRTLHNKMQKYRRLGFVE